MSDSLLVEILGARRVQWTDPKGILCHCAAATIQVNGTRTTETASETNMPLVPIITATLGTNPALAASIISGLNSRVYETVGGVVRKADTKEVVTWLRSMTDEPSIGPSAIQLLGPLVQLNAAVSILNLSITAVGFAVVMKRLAAVERRLTSISKMLEGIGRKIDLSFCANLRAALELARTAFAMTGENNRQAAATQAINRFLETEHLYLGLIDIELSEGGWTVSPLLHTQILATVSASRCYLELGEMETARRHLLEGAAAIEPRVRRFHETVVGVNPAIYLHPKLADAVTLERMTKLLHWELPGLAETQVFEKLRKSIWETASLNPDPWLKKLPTALWNHDVDGETKFGPVKRRRSSDEMFERLLPRLPDAFDQVEQAHEALGCVRGFEAELQFLLENKISFDDWQQVKMPSTSADDWLVCLIPENSDLRRLADSGPLLNAS